MKIEMQKSKYGEVLIIHLQTSIKAITFGFRIDPIEKLRQLERQVFNLWRIYHDKPIFGVDVEEEDVRFMSNR